jgi:hypothetical protein
MTIIRDTWGCFSNEIEIGIYMLSSMKNKPTHKVQIQSKADLRPMHYKLFNVIAGRFEPNELGRKYGAFITASTFTIGLKTTKIKQVAKELGISTIRVTRYKTI